MTWLLALIPPQLKFMALGLFAAITLAAGWAGHIIWIGYWAKGDAVAEVKAARQGEVNIIKFNSDFSKEKAHVQDACVDKPIPSTFKLLLNK